MLWLTCSSRNGAAHLQDCNTLKPNHWHTKDTLISEEQSLTHLPWLGWYWANALYGDVD